MRGHTKPLDWHTWRGDRGGRGRGRGRGGLSSGAPARAGWSSQAPPKPAFAASPEPCLGPLVSSLCKHDFDEKAQEYEPNSFITDCKTVASYNWLDRTEPTIVIPGMYSSQSPFWQSDNMPAPLCKSLDEVDV